MDIKTNREIISSGETVFDGIQEQSAELDYILPDYCPDIFRIIKCIASPRILSYSVSGDKLTYELSVCIRVLYCSEDSEAVHSAEQKLIYSKSADLGRTVKDPKVRLCPGTDYVNCRAVNKKRLDVRGAVSIKITVTAESECEVISDIYGMNMQTRKTPVTYISDVMRGSKLMTVSEEYDLGMSKPPVGDILMCNASVVSADQKVIANKLIVKGEAVIDMLYSCVKDGLCGIESMQFTQPFSQIIDMDGIDERYECTADAAVTSCELTPAADSDGEPKLVDCELGLLITCEGVKTSTAEIVTDAFSTMFECEPSVKNVRIECPPVRFCDSCIVKKSIEYKDGEISGVCAVWGKPSKISAKVGIGGEVIITGTALISAIVTSNEGKTDIIEEEAPFEFTKNIGGISENAEAEVSAAAVSCSFSMSSVGSIEVKLELRICGSAAESVYADAVTEVCVDEEKPVERDGDYALKLYFADDGEDIWDIAKKYKTSVSAVMEENDLGGDSVSGRMLLIPIV